MCPSWGRSREVLAELDKSLVKDPMPGQHCINSASSLQAKTTLRRQAHSVSRRHTWAQATHWLGFTARRVQSGHMWSSTTKSTTNACCKIAPLNTSACMR